MISGKKAALLFFVLAFAFTICNTYAQGTDTPPPPPCCTKDGTGEGISIPVIITPDSSMVVTVSDATLTEKGLTRAQFLDRVTALMLAPSDNATILLVIPVMKQVLAPDGSTSYQATYYSILKSEATAELLAASSALYITDGRTVIGINFISETKF
jgi:hypothetical protein